MKTITLGSTSLEVPQISLGCMRLNTISKSERGKFLQTALELGVTFFDHADCYGRGECEEIFSEAIKMNPTLREKIFLQSKCGIVPGKMFDFSKKHILKSTYSILQRLKTDYLDVLLLHRPDALFEPEEVAEAFLELHNKKKVRYFGVSNLDPGFITLLQKYLKQPIVANQLQLSLTNATLITQSLNMNMLDQMGIDRDNGTLNFCRLNEITIQPWSPFQHGFFAGSFINNSKFERLNQSLSKIAANYNVTSTTIALAWLLRHPAKFQPVIGTMNISRLQDCVKATEITLTREEWYELYIAAGHRLP